jgi:CHAT domain-containing protein
MPAMKLAAAAMVIILAGVGLYLIIAPESNVSRGLAALNKAITSGERPLEARISGIEYASYSETRSGDQKKIDNESMRRAEIILLDEYEENPGPEVNHALGRLYLAKGDFNLAIEKFELALKDDHDNAQLRSDLGAAWLEKGKSEEGEGSSQSILSLAEALKYLNQAYEMDDSLLEALFNRALAHEASMQPEQAIEEWRHYIEKDPDSRWGEEARVHLKQLEEDKNRSRQSKEDSFKEFLAAYEKSDDPRAWEILSCSKDTSGSHIVNRLLNLYLDHSLANENEKAGYYLRAIKYVGEAEARRGDLYTLHLARFYGSLPADDRARVKEARALMKRAYKKFVRSRFTKSIDLYTKARQTFEDTNNRGEVAFADYRIAHCLVLQPQRGKARLILEQLSSSIKGKQFLWIESQCFNQMANINTGLKLYSQSLLDSKQALELSERIDDKNGVLRNLSGIGDQHRFLNNPRESLVHLHRALNISRNYSTDRAQLWSIHTVIGLNLSSLQLPTAAVESQKEALKLALEMNRPLLVSRSYENVGLAQAKLKQYDEAIRNMGLAIQTGEALSGERNGTEIIAHACLQLGEIYREMGSYDKAIEAYDRSISLYSDLNLPYYEYPAQKGRLISYVSHGDTAVTEREISAVLHLLGQYHTNISTDEQRIRFFDVEQSIYDLAIDYYYSKLNNNEQAYEKCELSRARSLLDLIRAGEQERGVETSLPQVSASMSTSEVKQRVPAQAQLLQYAVLEDKTLIWVVKDSDIVPARIDIARQPLREKVDAFLREISGPAESFIKAEALSRELYEILIGPVETLLDKGKQLCVIPDKFLHRLPFTALLSPASDRYLVEDYAIVVAPSASAFILCTDIAEKKGAQERERSCIVGNPRFDRAAFPNLADLPAAAKEARAIAAYYPSSRTLVNEEAREATVKSDMQAADIAHLAMHFVADPTSPLLSKLALAKEPAARGEGEDGALHAHEIYKLNLSRLRLAILSGCQTGFERDYGGEGSISMARAFIARGVPLVLASLWPVETNSTAELMIEFHRLRKQERLATAEALRQAQRAMLRGEELRHRNPYYWASFAALGGYAAF